MTYEDVRNSARCFWKKALIYFNEPELQKYYDSTRDTVFGMVGTIRDQKSYEDYLYELSELPCYEYVMTNFHPEMILLMMGRTTRI